MIRNSILLSVFLLFSHSFFSQKNGNVFYSDLKEKKIDNNDEIAINASIYRLLKVDVKKVSSILSNVEYRGQVLRNEEIIIELPIPDGSTERFKVFRNKTLHPDLIKKFPQINTYDALCINNPGIVAKIDLTPHGFHAMIIIPGSSTVYIDPYIRGNKRYYICYRKKDFITDKVAQCLISSQVNKEIENTPSQHKGFGSCELRTYRLALAATGEYTSFHGGTQLLAQAAQVTTMNRVNGIFERDMSITMEIIPNNDLLIYTNSNTDPYTNGSPGSMISENQSTVNSVIGSQNYDIGHVFGTNSGGLAGLGVVCSNSQKAKGVTGSSSPIGDPFDVDYVSHEIGHQFGANHTFNNSCSGNRNNSTAMEPGSGNSIMAYAGICSPNTKSFSDDHFHGISLEEIESEIFSHSCPVITSIANSAPVISSTNGNIVIPINTPFALTAIATDVDGDSLTYNWEQMDNNVSTQPPVSSANGGPNFISDPPLTSPTRYFPNLIDLANGGPFTWEVLPSVSRTMDFRVVVRDNSFGNGCNDHADVTVTTDAGSGPFEITYPNATGITWVWGNTETVTWDVANTDLNPVNCSTVDIFLSLDGGVTYSTVLMNSVSNDGSQDVTVPSVTTNNARVMVMSSNGTFFDISDNDFIIGNISCIDPDTPTISGATNTCVGESTTLSIASGNLNDAQDWQWYENSCGGTAIGSGTSIVVTPSGSSNNYFVRGEGGCVVPGNCTQFNLIGHSLDTSVSVTSNSISSNQSGVAYQWIDCNNFNDPISGETSQTFMPLNSGNYGVIVIIGNCSDTSACNEINFTAIDQREIEGIQVFPNPTTQYITIDYSAFNKKIINIKLLDAIGKELYVQEQFDGSNTVLDLSKFTAGNYFLSIQTEKDSGFYKIFYK